MGMALIKRDRIGIVGATALLGKELSEELAESPLAASEIVLLDEDAIEGQLSAAGDEPALVLPLLEESFEGFDHVFFAGSPEQTRAYWQAARRGGATVIDLTHALVGEPGVVLRAPVVREAMAEAGLATGVTLGLETAAVVVAHPVAAMLALVAARLAPELTAVAATVMLPASEHERAGMDELHQQTVKLLSFHELPKTEFDAQSAFNLLAAFGEDARASLGMHQGQVTTDYDRLGGQQLPELLLQTVQAPVFHGYTASVLLEFRGERSVPEIGKKLAGRGVEVVDDDGDAPSNLNAAGRREVLVRVQRAGAAGRGRAWLWLAADNLKLRAAGAIECAMELRRLRPSGKVQ